MLFTITNTRFCLPFHALIAAGFAGLTFASPATAEPGHAHSDSSHQKASAAEGWEGDPFPLATDPVSGEALGDEPVVIEHNGREIRFASKTNAEKFRTAPDPNLLEIDQQIVANQLPYYPMTTCPISGEPLDAMGEPVDVVYHNRLVRFCCKGCKGDFMKDPAATIEKLDASVVAQQSKNYPLTTCPVSGQKLGSMGEPVEMVIASRLVKLCCAGCKGKLVAQPAQVLSELDAAWEASDAKPGVGGGEHSGNDDAQAKPGCNHGHDSHDHQH